MAFLIQAVHHHLIARFNLTRRFGRFTGRRTLLTLLWFGFVQLPAGSDQLVFLDRGAFLHREAAQVADDALGLLPRLGDNRRRFLLRFLQALIALLLQLLQLGSVASAQLFHLAPQLLGRFSLLLRPKAILFQRGDHVLDTHVLFGHFATGILQDPLRQSQPLGDGKRIASAGHAYQKAIRRT
ncbi:hypothetical protein D3C76_777000 [compost metagenome]